MSPDRSAVFEDETKKLAARLTIAVDEYSDAMNGHFENDGADADRWRGMYHCAVGSVLASVHFLTRCVLSEEPPEPESEERGPGVLNIVREADRED